MTCSICKATQLVYARLRALGKPIDSHVVKAIAKLAAASKTPLEAKRLIDAEIARKAGQSGAEQ